MLNATDKGADKYYHAVAQGSILALTDEDGVVKTKYNYSPFGETEMIVTQGREASDNPFQYTGRENDETGLYYYRYRYYEPSAKRFIAEDSIGFAGGMNFYSYVGNNPLRWIDPFGLTQLDIDVALELIRKSQKDLKVPDSVDTKDLPSGIVGETHPLTGKITLDVQYL